MNGLGEDLKLVPLSAGAVKQVGGGGLPGEEQNLACWQQFADPDCGIDAVEVGHDDITDEHVGLESARCLDGIFAGVYSSGFNSALVQNDCKGIDNDTLVVGD